MPQVRTVPALRKDREWFWRIIAVLMVFAVGWVAWIAWQLQPRESVATEQAFKAAQAPRIASATAQAPAAQAPTVAPPTPIAPAEQKPGAPAAVAEAEKPAAPPQVETPKPAAKAPAKAATASKSAPAAAPRSLNLDVPPARILQAPVQVQGPARVEKRDRIRSPDDRAEAEFRRGVGLLNQGRSSEAEEAFAGALVASPAHEAARQALVAMQLEQRRIDEARRLLQEGVALNPGNVRFASVLARVLLERRDYAGALEVVNGLKAGQGDPDILAVRGTALQRLGRHAEAVDAFQASARREPQNGAVWMGLGISLEALGKKTDAAEAFRRAAASGTLGNDARSYAEQRARQLQ
jgi:MSHA biogenesis protein MshN